MDENLFSIDIEDLKDSSVKYWENFTKRITTWKIFSIPQKP